MKYFADGGEIWIDASQSRVPLLPESTRDVWKRIHAKAIEARRLDPPDGVLQKIFCDNRILGVHVRQNAEKPAISNVAAHRRRAVRIGQCLERIVCNACRIGLAIEGILYGR